MEQQHHLKLNVWAFALSFGVVWAFSMFFLGIAASCCGFGMAFVDAIGTMYIGYEATFVGSLIGAAWGFVDFFVFGLLIAWFYNLFSHCHCCCPFKKK